MRNDKINGLSVTSSPTRRHSSCLCTDAAPLFVVSVTHTSIVVAPLSGGKRPEKGSRPTPSTPIATATNATAHGMCYSFCKLFIKSYNAERENPLIN